MQTKNKNKQTKSQFGLREKRERLEGSKVGSNRNKLIWSHFYSTVLLFPPPQSKRITNEITNITMHEIKS